MNAIATSHPQLSSSATTYTLEVFHRMHGGRWPSLRTYYARRLDDYIFEVARWLRSSNKSYCVITWRLSEISMRWRSFPTLAEAREHARSLG